MERLDDLFGALTPDDRLADANAAEVQQLFQQIRHAVHAADMDTEKVAEQIGLSVGAARRLLDGDVDISLSDLEVLLIAVGGQLRIDVTSRHQPAPSAERVPWLDSLPASATRKASWRPHPAPPRPDAWTPAYG